MGRKKGIREQEEVIYIVGEGLTEQQYFSHLKHIKGYRYQVKPRFCTNTSIREITDKVESLLSDGATVICVFDADNSHRQESERLLLQKFMAKYGNNESVIICDSLQCIEYWFILHYEDCCPLHSDGLQTLRHLKKHLPQYDKTEAFLGKRKWVENLIDDGRLEAALNRARKYEDGNSYTHIYRAFDKLTNK